MSLHLFTEWKAVEASLVFFRRDNQCPRLRLGVETMDAFDIRHSKLMMVREAYGANRRSVSTQVGKQLAGCSYARQKDDRDISPKCIKRPGRPATKGKRPEFPIAQRGKKQGLARLQAQPLPDLPGF